MIISQENRVKPTEGQKAFVVASGACACATGVAALEGAAIAAGSAPVFAPIFFSPLLPILSPITPIITTTVINAATVVTALSGPLGWAAIGLTGVTIGAAGEELNLLATKDFDFHGNGDFPFEFCGDLSFSADY